MSPVPLSIDSVVVRAATIPTDAPEADGTLDWTETTIVIATIRAGGKTGIGWTWADAPTARLARDRLGPLLIGRCALDVEAAFSAMAASIRNLGRQGIAAMAISAVDAALWDLKAVLFGVPLFRLLGGARTSIAAYGSGGFTTYPIGLLQRQLGGWVEQGFDRVKMKVGRDAAADLDRVAAARAAIGPDVALFVDANGAYSRKQALAQAERFADSSISWFEEPVSSDDLAGLRLLRDRAPAGMDIAAGEYGYESFYFRRMLEAGAVDILQADATRCGGPTGFLRAAAICDSFGLPLSSHCSPQLHAHLCCAVSRAVHLEYFHDHARIERLLFEGVIEPVGGELRPDPSLPGIGVEPRWPEFERYEIAI